MKTILVTGANGFIGRNLVAHLRVRKDLRVLTYDVTDTVEDLQRSALEADLVCHLAGVNRPESDDEFETGNAGLTDTLCRLLEGSDRRARVLFSSSVQATLDNPYAASKRRAEERLTEHGRRHGADVVIFRLKNVFGKWCRPNYNSVVATFCHNTAHGLPLQINDPARALELIYVDDVVQAFMREIDRPAGAPRVTVTDGDVASYTLTLGDLADRLRGFRAIRSALVLPDFSIRFNQQLYVTYLSYVPPADWGYGLDVKSDPRGTLAEFVKSPSFGQIFVSRTKPGITRGNHYHHTKTEKFLVLAGSGIVRFRHIDGTEILEFPVRGEDYRVIDIPPGFTHSITNVGSDEMVTLFWASEIFDPGRPDTIFEPVDGEATRA